MSDYTAVPAMNAVAEGGAKLRTRVSFSSVLVGTLIAIAIGLLLHLLGLGVGMTSVDAVDRDSPSATTVLLMAGAWTLFTALASLGIGGYAAARLSGNADRWDSSLHGLGVWGCAVTLSSIVAGVIAIGSATTATNAVGSVLGGAVRGGAAAAGAAAGTAAPRIDDPAGLVQQLRTTLATPADVSRMTTEQRGAEIAAIVGNRVRDGEFGPGQRRRLAALIAAEAGIPEAEAEQRITAYEQRAREAAQRAEQRAREVADAAATAGAISAFWAFAALLIGAAAAVLGAAQGARDIAYLRPPP